jgi:putative redox protein
MLEDDMANTATMTLIDGLRFNAETGSGHTVELDSRTDETPLAAPTPMELQLVALGGCAAMDVISILRKMRQDVTEYAVELTGERASEHPKVYTTVDVVHRLRGRDIAEDSVRRAIELTIERYCPVFNMLYPKVAIRELYTIEDESSGAKTEGIVTRGD